MHIARCRCITEKILAVVAERSVHQWLDAKPGSRRERKIEQICNCRCL